jgi:hypothetical protein
VPMMAEQRAAFDRDGWNIHIYHSHLDVHPRSGSPCRSASAGTKTAAGKTVSSRPPRGRGCR